MKKKITASSSWQVICSYACCSSIYNEAKLMKAAGKEKARPSCFLTHGWLNGCNVYSCPLWAHCIFCCLDSSQTPLWSIVCIADGFPCLSAMDIYFTYTYCILLLRQSDELMWPWYYSGRYSIGKWARGVIKSWITAHDTHRTVELSARRRKDEKTWIT